MSTTETSQPMGLVTRQSGELAISASAAHAKALVEAKFIMALQRPRNILQVRDVILAACRRPAFAASAWYAKPVGGGKVRGPSIRFAETAIQAMTNITVIPSIVHEDDEKRVMFIEVIDLQTNTSYGDTVTISKTVERKDKKGREVISERPNSYGEIVYTVVATEDEIANKANSAKSKIIRNSGLRLIPQDLIEEAEQEIRKTMETGGGDNRAESIKRMADAFSEMGVKPNALEQYLGHALDSTSPSELSDLRQMFATIRDGEAKWADYLEGNKGTKKDLNFTQAAKEKVTEAVVEKKKDDGFNLDATPSPRDSFALALNENDLTAAQAIEKLNKILNPKRQFKTLSDVPEQAIADTLNDWDTLINA